MSGTFGIGSFLTGLYLWWDAEGTLATLLSGVGPIGSMGPGLLMLMGVATLGFSLIRIQNA